MVVIVFFFNDTATTEIYTLSLHDALPISRWLPIPGTLENYRSAIGKPHFLQDVRNSIAVVAVTVLVSLALAFLAALDRKSTRLNSSHANISYAVFCLKKKKNTYYNPYTLL